MNAYDFSNVYQNAANMQQQVDPMSNFARGFEIGSVMRQQRDLAKKREQEILMQTQMNERAKSLQGEMANFEQLTDPYQRVQFLNNIGVKFPELADKFNNQSKFYSEEVKTNAMNTLLPAFNALNLGNKDVAIARLTTAAEAFKNSGNTKGADSINAYIEDIKTTENIAPLVQTGYLFLASILGADKLTDTLKSSQEYAKTQAIMPEQIAQEKSQTIVEAEKAKQAPLETAIKQEEVIRAPLETKIKFSESVIKGSDAKFAGDKNLAQLQLLRQQAQTSRANQLQSQQSISESQARVKKLNEAQQPTNGAIVDLGLPIPARLPWANMTDEKQKNVLMGSIYKTSEKELNKKLETVQEMKSVAQDVDRFIELNKKVGTGGIIDRLALGRGAVGLTNSEYDEMRAISARLAPKMRPEGSGATSDFDAKQYERATVGVDKTGNANVQIGKAVKARAQAAIEYQDYLQNYLTQNGTLADADRYWKEYSNKYPILDPKKAGTFELNKNRIPPEMYFAVKAEKERRGIK